MLSPVPGALVPTNTSAGAPPPSARSPPMPRSFDKRLRASFDPLQSRRGLHRIESGLRPTRRRRVVAVMRLPRREGRNQQLKGKAK